MDQMGKEESPTLNCGRSSVRLKLSRTLLSPVATM
jgi:hypothetical protein